MIPTIGLMIGLYILARYSEMSKTASGTTKVVLAIFSLITIICIISLLFTSASIPSVR